MDRHQTNAAKTSHAAFRPVEDRRVLKGIFDHDEFGLGQIQSKLIT
jgi:hypothetical protein